MLPPMKCNDAQSLLAVSLDETLSPAEQSRLDSHLHECSPCVNWLTQHVVLREVLRGLGRIEESELPPPVPEHLIRRILTAHKDALAKHRSGRKTG